MTEETDLYVLGEKVGDETSFLKFAEALLNDWLDEGREERSSPSSLGSAGANGWQYGDLAGFLEAAIAWATDHPAFNSELNPWWKFALFLHAGKFYE